MDPNVAISLFEANIRLLKAADNQPVDLIRFGGIASSEAMDVQGDTILRKALDISYLQRRGYVNWNHLKEPEYQLGFTTKAHIIQPTDVAQYEDIFQLPLSKASSVFVEGQFYRHNKQAMHVVDILRSIPEGQDGSLGLSVEGAMLKVEDQPVVKAIVRGVAVTPAPVQPDTLCRLVKSLSSGLSSSVEHETRHAELLKAAGLSYEQAVIKVMELRPNIPLDLAKKIARFVFERKGQGAAA